MRRGKASVWLVEMVAAPDQMMVLTRRAAEKCTNGSRRPVIGQNCCVSVVLVALGCVSGIVYPSVSHVAS